jgi:hypothetical protein
MLWSRIPLPQEDELVWRAVQERRLARINGGRVRGAFALLDQCLTLRLGSGDLGFDGVFRGLQLACIAIDEQGVRRAAAV